MRSRNRTPPHAEDATTAAISSACEGRGRGGVGHTDPAAAFGRPGLRFPCHNSRVPIGAATASPPSSPALSFEARASPQLPIAADRERYMRSWAIAAACCSSVLASTDDVPMPFIME